MGEIENMRNALPEYYQMLVSLEEAIGVPMKGNQWLEADEHASR